MTRVLFLAERVSLGADGRLPPYGSAAHTAATLAGLRSSFDVLPLTADAASAEPSRLRPVRSFVPSRVRGMRQDILALRASETFRARAAAKAVGFGPDVIYERSEYLVRTGTRLSSSLGVPLVLEVNGIVADDVRTIYRSLLEPVGARIELRKLARAAVVVVESPGMADAVASCGVEPERVAIVPNSVPSTRVRSEPRVARSDRAVVAWLGHLMPWHAQALHFLIRAASGIVAEEPRIRFAIFGGGPALDGLVSAAGGASLEGVFDFPGVVPYEEAPARLEEADIALIPDMPPHKLPVKIVEFGAAGLPLVAPRSPSLDRQLEPFVEYQPFRRGDAASMQQALVTVVRDLELRNRLAAHLHTAVRERFTWDATADLLRDVVRRAVAT